MKLKRWLRLCTTTTLRWASRTRCARKLSTTGLIPPASFLVQASRAVIKKAYRDLARTHHPDKKGVASKTFGEMQADLDGRRVRWRVRSSPLPHPLAWSSLVTAGLILFNPRVRINSEAHDFRMVQEAWDILSDEEKRSEYDLMLKYYRQEQEK